ncbi:MAG: cobalamin B12-binding domain-containing protein [Lachnospiraceae bacterium]|jgi:methanogenic corrinoid protein MtbC1
MNISLLEEIKDSVKDGFPKSTEQLVQQALQEQIDAQTILDKALIPAIREAGEAYHNNEIFIARILACSRSLRSGLTILRPYLQEEDSDGLGTIILGTVQGDLHDVGKNLVRIMFEGVGFHTIDLGVDVSEKKFLKAFREHPETKIICLSSLLTTTMLEMEPIIRALRKADKKHRLLIMVGGAPLSQEFADEIGADYYTATAWEAASLAQKLVTAEKEQKHT